MTFPTLGEDSLEAREAIISAAVDAYNENPELLPEELRAAVEAYLGLIDDPYGI